MFRLVSWKALRVFREDSTPAFRAKPYFKYLMKMFRNLAEHPFFDRFWKMVFSTDQDKEVNVDQFSYLHREFGHLKYLASTTVAVTSFGNLFLSQNLPLDKHTEDVFTQLKGKAGLGVMQFASWPEEQIGQHSYITWKGRHCFAIQHRNQSTCPKF